MAILFLALILKSPISIAGGQVDNRLSQIKINLDIDSSGSYLSHIIRKPVFRVSDQV